VRERERLFFAVPIPRSARVRLQERLTEIAGEDGLPGRPVPPENWHLTIRFLGEVEGPVAEAARRSVAGARLGRSFEAEVGGLGAFPRSAGGRVLWAGISHGHEALASLAARVEAAVRDAGLPPETRPFRPHLTLARLREPADVRRWTEGDLSPVRFRVDELVLYRSRLGPGGARHEALEHYALAPPTEEATR
jgi:RNA 2',3'-cyclic 3'-phosphodiesterase